MAEGGFKDDLSRRGRLAISAHGAMSISMLAVVTVCVLVSVGLRQREPVYDSRRRSVVERAADRRRPSARLDRYLGEV